jgi:hypothetical protein
VKTDTFSIGREQGELSKSGKTVKNKEKREIQCPKFRKSGKNFSWAKKVWKLGFKLGDFPELIQNSRQCQVRRSDQFFMIEVSQSGKYWGKKLMLVPCSY